MSARDVSPSARTQKSEFLRTDGAVVDVCGGLGLSQALTGVAADEGRTPAKSLGDAQPRSQSHHPAVNRRDARGFGARRPRGCAISHRTSEPPFRAKSSLLAPAKPALELATPRSRRSSSEPCGSAPCRSQAPVARPSFRSRRSSRHGSRGDLLHRPGGVDPEKVARLSEATRPHGASEEIASAHRRGRQLDRGRTPAVGPYQSTREEGRSGSSTCC